MLAERRAHGLDIRDEVWEGVYVVMAPAPSVRHAMISADLIALFRPHADRAGLRVGNITNIGRPDDYRIPDVFVVRPKPDDADAVWLDTAAIAVEIKSPGEAHEEKLPFYAGRGVREVVLVDPDARTVRWLVLEGGSYRETDRSQVLEIDVSRDVLPHLRWE